MVLNIVNDRIVVFGTQTGTVTLVQSGLRINGNEGVFHIPQTFRTGDSPSDAVLCYTQDIR